MDFQRTQKLNKIYYDYAVDANGKARLSKFKYGNENTGQYLCEMREDGTLHWYENVPEFTYDVISGEFERLQCESVMIRYGIQRIFEPPPIVNRNEFTEVNSYDV